MVWNLYCEGYYGPNSRVLHRCAPPGSLKYSNQKSASEKQKMRSTNYDSVSPSLGDKSPSSGDTESPYSCNPIWLCLVSLLYAMIFTSLASGSHPPDIILGIMQFTTSTLVRSIFIIWTVIIRNWFPLLRIILGIIVSSAVGSISIAAIRYAASAYYSAKQMAAPPKQQLKSRSKKRTNTLLLFLLLLFLPSAHAMKTGDIDKEIDEVTEGVDKLESPIKPDSKRRKRGGGDNSDGKGVPIDMNVDNEPPTDKAILEQLVTDCAGGILMLIPLEYVRVYDDSNRLMLAMKWGVEQLINIKRNPTSAEEIETAMKKFDEKIQEAVEALYKSYEKLVNMGDGAIRGASAMALLNYATTKESTRAWDSSKQKRSTRRGQRSLMDPKASECLRMVVQTFARASLNAFRTTYGLEIIDSNLFCTSIILLDMCFIAFDNPGNTESGYKEQVETIANNLCLGECADDLKAKLEGDLGLAKRVLVFAVSSIKFIFHALHYQAEKGVNHKPLPFIVFSSYPDKYWFKGRLGDVARSLIHKMGTMYHPDFCLRKFGRALSADTIKGVNKILFKFYSQVKEVRGAMKSAAVGGGEEESIIDDTEPVHQIFERVDTPLTEEERQHEIELMKQGRIKGGEASALLLNLGKAIEKNGSVSEDDWGNWDLSDEDWDIFNNLLEKKYRGKMQRLIEVMKNRLNSWTVCQNVRRLRIAFMDKSTTISPEGYNQLDNEDKDLFDATIKMELADGTAITKNKLYEMIAASAQGWSFCIKLPRLISIMVHTAKGSNISVESQSDVFTMEVYNAMSKEDDQEFTSIASEMKLKSTNGQPVDIPTLLEKMRSFHNGEYNEKVLDGHIGKCKQIMKENNEGKWYIPGCKGDNQSTYSFIWLIRDLESGDYGYWKVQAFADAGVDLSKWDQSINEDIIDEEQDKKTAPMREERRALKSRRRRRLLPRRLESVT